MKMNKKLLVLTSFIVLIPIFIGLALWNQIPDQVPTHFDFSGNPDDYSSKFQAVFFLPFFLLILHLFCLWITTKDPKSGRLGKVQYLVYWIVPIISIFVQTMVILSSIHKGFQFNANLFMGFLFLILGNYLPKIRQNYTVGIKIPWTLNNEMNWNKTHRLAGKIWVTGGILFLLMGMLGITNPIPVFGLLIILILIPMVYSYWLYKYKQL
ncbi:SdpI family protein [Streptococcus uberis]|uniref:SdpI family protein n=1 Tax=Streptococcus uberis TaxID=1349 RepID=UPI00193A766A|nr:SdpI family protein [Streptococcus uberis]